MKFAQWFQLYGAPAGNSALLFIVKYVKFSSVKTDNAKRGVMKGAMNGNLASDCGAQNDSPTRKKHSLCLPHLPDIPKSYANELNLYHNHHQYTRMTIDIFV